MRIITIIIIVVAVTAMGSGTIIYLANKRPSVNIVFVSSLVYPDNRWIDKGGTVYTGKTLRIYAQASDTVTTSKDLTVNIRYKPQRGSWTTKQASFNSTLDYWYTDWVIPGGATLGLYDVNVNVSDGKGGSANSTSTGQFNVVANPNPIMAYVNSRVYPENQLLKQGGTVSVGKTLRVNTQVSDAKTASKDLIVYISIRPQGGSWITSVASYNQTKDNWYLDWRIPSNATTGFYDVRVGVSTPDGRSTTNTTLNTFRVSNYVLDMPFNDASVPVKDLSGYGNDATPYSVTWQPNYGGCYSFNGVNSYINRQNMTGLSTTQLSFSFWSKQGGTSSSYMHLIGLFGDHRATIFVAPDTYNYYYKFSNVSGVTYQAPIGTLDSGWHHTAVVFDGSRLAVYVDGVERVNIPAPGVINKIDDSLFVGATGTGASPAGNYFNGLLDGVRVYGRALSADEVKVEYNAGKAEHELP